MKATSGTADTVFSSCTCVWVFVAKSSSSVFDAQVIDVLRGIFADVCTGAHATLVRMEGEDDHVHLLVLKRLSAEGTDIHVEATAKTSYGAFICMIPKETICR